MHQPQQDQQQAPPPPKGEGLVKLKDGLSRCESEHDLYAYVRKPAVVREKLPPKEPLPEPRSVQLKRDVRQKIDQGTWFGKSKLLNILRSLVRALFYVFVFPFLFFCYLVPKWIITVIVTFILLMQKAYIVLVNRLQSLGKRIVDPVKLHINRLKSKCKSLFSFKSESSFRFKWPLFSVKEKIMHKFGGVQRWLNRFSVWLGSKIDGCLKYPRLMMKKIALRVEKVRDLRLQLRAWLLKAPLYFISQIAQKIG